jgi:hypothetical protein
MIKIFFFSSRPLHASNGTCSPRKEGAVFLHRRYICYSVVWARVYSNSHVVQFAWALSRLCYNRRSVGLAFYVSSTHLGPLNMRIRPSIYLYYYLLCHWAICSFIDSPRDVSSVDVGHEVPIGSWIFWMPLTLKCTAFHISPGCCVLTRRSGYKTHLLCVFVAVETHFNRTVVEIDTQQFFLLFCAYSLSRKPV